MGVDGESDVISSTDYSVDGDDQWYEKVSQWNDSQGQFPPKTSEISGLPSLQFPVQKASEIQYIIFVNKLARSNFVPVMPNWQL